VHALKFVAPLIPTLVEKPPEGDDWIHEVKFDGYPLDAGATPAGPLRKSRAIVLTLAALFSLEAAGAIFSCTGVLSAVPYLMVCKSPNGSGS
jgi:hypothetical protein